MLLACLSVPGGLSGEGVLSPHRVVSRTQVQVEMDPGMFQLLVLKLQVTPLPRAPLFLALWGILLPTQTQSFETAYFLLHFRAVTMFSMEGFTHWCFCSTPSCVLAMGIVNCVPFTERDFGGVAAVARTFS